MTRTLFLTKYGQRAASTRYRATQFLPRLAAEGIHGTIAPLLDDAYLDEKFRTGTASAAHYVRSALRRVGQLLQARRFDVLVIYFELFPYFPGLLERILGKAGIPWIYDFDDAIFHQYDLHGNPWVRRLLSRKIERVIGGASAVTAGNEYLAQYARRANTHVHILPTVVDVDKYVPIQKEGSEPLVVGWMGSPATAPYLAEIAEPMRVFLQETDSRFVIVGAGNRELPGLPAERVEWTEENEISDIQRFDVGIMPLPDTPWARGKCGFKLIQYMACGLPVIASPVGVNSDIVESGRNGLLASNSADWLRALRTIHSDRAAARGMGERGRRTVEQSFSLQSAAPRLASIIREALI